MFYTSTMDKLEGMIVEFAPRFLQPSKQLFNVPQLHLTAVINVDIRKVSTIFQNAKGCISTEFQRSVCTQYLLSSNNSGML